MKNKLQIYIRESSISKAILLLDRNDRIKIIYITSIQIFLGMLDLIGILIIGWIGGLAVQGIGLENSKSNLKIPLEFLQIEGLTFQKQIAYLSILSASVLLLKTLASIYFTKRTFRFLAKKSAELSANILSKFLAQDLLGIQKKKSQEALYALTTGVENIMLGVVASSITIIGDCAMLVVILGGLLTLDPLSAFGIFFIFSTVAYSLHKMLSNRSRQIGKELNSLTVKNNAIILESIISYREMMVRNRRSYYVQEFRSSRANLEKLNAELSFQPFISKYVMESMLIMGTLVIAGLQFYTKNAIDAVSLLVVFAAATTRIAPAILRIQQSFLTWKSCSGSADSTFSMIDELAETHDLKESLNETNFYYHGFIPSINLKDIRFVYPNNSKFELKIETLKIEAGLKVAIVGESGSGKTTLIDIIMGVIQAKSGTIKISGMSPLEVIERWPGSVSYVSQNILVTPESVRKNVGLGYDRQQQTDERIWESLKIAQLEKPVRDLTEQLESEIGEYGNRLSGGQRQRLNIARALFTAPKLLILDEATSSLDAQTEQDLNNSLNLLRGQTTLIIIAHRISTIRDADQVIYVEKGQILASGTFDEIRSKVPKFNNNAQIMGLQ
jgi:ABC-type multidrug transport system fused ATPase/permease subunit